MGFPWVDVPLCTCVCVSVCVLLCLHAHVMCICRIYACLDVGMCCTHVANVIFDVYFICCLGFYIETALSGNMFGSFHVCTCFSSCVNVCVV